MKSFRDGINNTINAEDDSLFCLRSVVFLLILLILSKVFFGKESLFASKCFYSGSEGQGAVLNGKELVPFLRFNTQSSQTAWCCFSSSFF